jgi:hypothetical protein
MSAENIPRCYNCSAFFNKYSIRIADIIRCGICGFESPLNGLFDSVSPECRCDVYEGHCTSRYLLRQHFVPTDFFVLSLSLLQARPEIIDTIAHAYDLCSAPKQIGLAVLHGGFTAVRFRPRTLLLTFSDGAPMARPSAFFAGLPDVREIILGLKPRLLGLQFSQADQFLTAVQFSVSLCAVYGSSLHLILDEGDFHALASAASLRNTAFEMLRGFAQVSLVVCIDSLLYESPLLELPAVTGGFCHFFPAATPDSELQAVLDTSIKAQIYHDAYLFSPRAGVKEFAGRGLQVSPFGFDAGKVEVGEAFHFIIDVSKLATPFLQFVLFYTNDLSVRKMRVITLSLADQPPVNWPVIADCAAAVVAQALLNEGPDVARNALKKLRGQFKKHEFSAVEAMLAEQSVLRRCRLALMMRSGRRATSIPIPDAGSGRPSGRAAADLI